MVYPLDTIYILTNHSSRQFEILSDPMHHRHNPQDQPDHTPQSYQLPSQRLFDIARTHGCVVKHFTIDYFFIYFCMFLYICKKVKRASVYAKSLPDCSVKDTDTRSTKRIINTCDCHVTIYRQKPRSSVTGVFALCLVFFLSGDSGGCRIPEEADHICTQNTVPCEGKKCEGD